MQPSSNEQPPAPSEDDLSAADLEFIDLDTTPRQPPSRRRRLYQAALVLAALAVGLVALWRVILPQRPLAPAPTPTANPLLIPVLLQSDVTNGTVTVNGQKQPGHLPMIVMMSEDQDQIEMDAPPFERHICTVDALLVPNPDLFAPCQVNGGDFQQMTLNGVTATPQAEVDILFGLTYLPGDQQASVLSLVSQALAIHADTQVPTGSYIATGVDNSGMITSERASKPLLASALFTNDVVGFKGESGFCGQPFCPGPAGIAGPTASASQVWTIGMNAGYRWRFTAPSGAVVGEVTFGQPSYASIAYIPLTLFLTYDPAAGWQMLDPEGTITGALASDNCNVGITLLSMRALTLSTQGVGIAILHDQGMEGCEMQLQVGSNNTNAGLFVWRFGVLLAADGLAHKTFLDLPLAPPAEIAAVGG